MSEIKPVYETRETFRIDWIEVDEERYNRRIADTELYEGRILYPAAAYEAQAHRANALALVINDLTKICTHSAETKDQFIDRVKAILSVDPDLRASEMQVAYEALQKENAELLQNLESEKLANTRLAEIIKENNNKMSAGVYTTNEQYAKEVKEHDDLLTAIEALEIKHEGALDSIRQCKQRIEELEAATEHLGLTPKQAADGLVRYKAQVAEIESLRKQVAEFEAIDEKQLEEILFAVTDGLATHNLRFVMLDSINHILKRSASKNGE